MESLQQNKNANYTDAVKLTLAVLEQPVSRDVLKTWVPTREVRVILTRNRSVMLLVKIHLIAIRAIQIITVAFRSPVPRENLTLWKSVRMMDVVSITTNVRRKCARKLMISFRMFPPIMSSEQRVSAMLLVEIHLLVKTMSVLNFPEPKQVPTKVWKNANKKVVVIPISVALENGASNNQVQEQTQTTKLAQNAMQNAAIHLNVPRESVLK
jgi:hypothetical protein